MHIVVRQGDRERELDLVRDHPDAAVSDLTAALAALDITACPETDDPTSTSAPGGLLVDGRLVDPDLGLDEAGLVSGSIVELVDQPGSDGPGPGRHERATTSVLAVVGGPGAGASIPMQLGATTIVGRGSSADVDLADPTVSPKHIRLTLAAAGATIEDLGSLNGTRVDGEPVRDLTDITPGDLIQCGAVEAELRPRVCDDRPVGLDPARMAAGGLMAFNRPPRPALWPDPDPIAVPDAPAQERRVAAFSLVTLVAPLLMALVMVTVMGTIRFALFALMGPVLFLGNQVATRRRNTKEAKSSARRFRRDLEQFRVELAGAARAERSRREALVPDPAEIVRRAELPSTRLWERRPSHPDYLELRIGRGPVSWAPPVDSSRVGADEALRDAVDDESVITRCPVVLDLAGGGVVGLVGERSSALALARSLVAQACVLHGPADLGLTVLADRLRSHEWDWAKWLPHAKAPGGDGRLLSQDTVTSHDLMDTIVQAAADRAREPGLGEPVDHSAAAMLVVVDDEQLTAGRRSPTRAVLRGQAGPVAGIVLASTADRLPAVCDTIVHLHDDLGDASVSRPQHAQRIDEILIAGLDDDTARQCARNLARFEDPEIAVAGGELPTMVRLLPLLGLEEVTAAEVLARWEAAGPDPAPSAAVGIAAEGVLELDLVADGPHGLVGGTTGAGKSEFLRSLVAGMAARLSPRNLVFVLVDYKGGSAFDECARLPHTVGMVTDLDAHLGERALRSLDAELHHRERILRSHGASDLHSYLENGAPGGPVPRLVLVVDEFATMAAELPEFMGALVGIAQRGRSLGVHMILATQRPSGAVNANIKANTNIRVALRVQDVGDSMDVIDRVDAAKIPRGNPGRAFVRLGPGDVVPVQTALSTAAAPSDAGAAVSVRPFRFVSVPSAFDVPGPVSTGPSDLVTLVDACCEAFGRSGLEPPRRPWLEMLGERVTLAEVDLVLADQDGIPIGLADDPRAQRRCAVTWCPAAGHLGLFGAVGSGTTTATITAVLAAARDACVDELHVYGVDYGGGGLGALAGLPHCGAVLAANERERHQRLIRFLANEVARRRDLDAAARGREPRIVVAIDGAPAFLADFDGLDGQETLDALKRVLAEGTGVGVCFVLTAERCSALPMRLLTSVTNRLLFQHADPGDLSAIGVRAGELPAFVPGRALHAETKLVVQVAWVEDAPSMVDAIVDASTDGSWSMRPPDSIEALPTAVVTAAVDQHLRVGAAIELPLGIAETDRSVRSLPLYPGDHLFIAGQARSGVSTTLRFAARLLHRASAAAVMVAVADGRSPLRADAALFDALGTPSQLAKVFELAALDTEREWVLVVDDAHGIDEPHGLDALVRAPHCRLLVGGRSEQLHGQFNHWTRLVSRSGAGVLLQPRLEADGDLLGVRLPRRLQVPLVPGRGFLVADGAPTLVQVAGADLAA